MTQSEAELEQQLIEHLTKLGYKPVTFRLVIVLMYVLHKVSVGIMLHWVKYGLKWIL